MSTCTETYYIESTDDLLEKLVRIDAIILALENNIQNESAATSGIQSYMLDDGQVKINTQYRDIFAITKGIQYFEQQKQTILNKLNGRQTVLRPARGLI